MNGPPEASFEGRVIISGIGRSQVGRRLGIDPLRLTADACLAAVADAGLSVGDIDGLVTYPGAHQAGPGFSGASVREIHDSLGVHPAWTSGGAEFPGQLGAVVSAMLAVAGGLARHVLVWRSIWEGSAQGSGGRQGYGAGGGRAAGQLGWQLPFGATAASLAAMQIRVRMLRHGLTREQLGIVPVTLRANARNNPAAVYRDPLALEDYLEARMVSEPLSLYDCDVPCDGATAFVVSRREHARNLDHPAIAVSSVSCRHDDDRFGWEYGQDLARMSSRWTDVWSRTSLTPRDVDVAGLYDGFSIFVHCWLEDLGFCPVGEAAAFVGDGSRLRPDGDIPLNTDGGQLSGGRLHGFGYLHEVALQLRGDAGDRQVPGNPEVGVVGVGAANSGTTSMVLTRNC